MLYSPANIWFVLLVVFQAIPTKNLKYDGKSVKMFYFSLHVKLTSSDHEVDYDEEKENHLPFTLINDQRPHVDISKVKIPFGTTS